MLDPERKAPCFRCIILGLAALPIILAHATYQRWRKEKTFMDTLDELSERFAEVDRLRVELERKHSENVQR